MKVVVNKQALAGFIDQALNEDRSFHTKNVNELEKSQPQIFPQEQMAQQLTQTKVPVDDATFEPTNKSELGKAAMQLSDKVSDDKIKEFYASLKKLAKKNSDDPGEINLREARRAIDRIVFKLMTEGEGDMGDDDDDDIDDSHYERLLGKGLATNPMLRAFDRIKNIIDNLSRDEKKEVFFRRTEDKPFDDPLAPNIYEPKEDMQEIVDDLMRSRLSMKIMEEEGVNNSVRVEQMKKMLFQYFEANRPKITPDLAPVVLNTAAAKLIDMIWNDHRDDIDGFIKKSKELVQDLKSKMGQKMEIWPAPEKGMSPWFVDVDRDFIDRVRGQFLKYLRKFGKAEKDVVAIEEPDTGVVAPVVKKEKLPTSPREITTYSETLEALVSLRNNEPDEFMKLVKSLGTIDVNGQKIALGSMSIEDFDDLDDTVKTQVLYQASKDKDLSGNVYRWLQNFERTAGMKMYKDKDYLPSYNVVETAPGEFTIQALPWKSFPEDLVEMYYDTCVKSVINSALIRGFNLDFPSFMSSFSSNEKLSFRKSIKDVLYNLILANRSDFEDTLDVWYEFHDTKNKIATLKKYEKEIDILNSSGFAVSSTEMDQYFTNLKSASLDVYHLANGILYAIALKHIHELIEMGNIRSNQPTQVSPDELLKLLRDVFESEDGYESFYRLIKNKIPMNIKLTLDDFLNPWDVFYNKNKQKIDDGIAKKIAQTGGVRGAVDPASLNFFEELITLVKSEDKEEDEDDDDFKLGNTVGDDVESVKETLADLLNTMLGGARKGGATTYSSVPAGIGMLIIKALKAYAPTAPADKAQVAESALNILTNKDKIKTVGGITINDPKGIMTAKQISESLMESIMMKIISSNYKTQRTLR